MWDVSMLLLDRHGICYSQRRPPAHAQLHMAQIVDLATNKDAHGQGCGLHTASSWVCYQALTPSLYILDRPACDSILPPPRTNNKALLYIHASEPKCTNYRPPPVLSLHVSWGRIATGPLPRLVTLNP